MTAQNTHLVSHRVIGSLVERLAEFGIGRFYYTIVPDDERSIADTLGCCSSFNAHRAFNLKRMRYAVASDEGILRYRDEFLRRFSRSDQGFAQSGPGARKRANPFYWPEDRAEARRTTTLKQLQQLKRRHQVASQLTYYHPLPQRPGWLGIFNLFAAGPMAPVRRAIDEGRGEFQELLGEYAETFNVLAFRSINPLANFGVLSPTCVQILGLVADGHSSEEIGQQMFMTERGVNYHLDRARQILMARNRTNLVSKAYLHGVL